MLSIFAKNLSAQPRAVLKHLYNKDFTRNGQVIGICHDNLSRFMSSKVTEENKFSVIYRGPLATQIKAVKIFSLTSSMAGLLAQPIIIKQANTIGSVSLLVVMCSVVGFFTFITPLLLHFITKKYVTELEHNPETSTYRAITINFFMAEKQIEFNVDDVDVPEIPGMFTTMKVKGTPLFVEARHFSDPMHYARLMGYDKPMDFKLGDHDSQGDSKDK